MFFAVMCGTPYLVRWIFASSGLAAAVGTAISASAATAARRRPPHQGSPSRTYRFSVRGRASARVATAANRTWPPRTP